ncbi:hypothetical protein F0562_030987 [Nyssa sinensis]|uniref:Uncharacterized protein n=1 Tax=Nyssa sinensis TaxID=561372 RepID=A0A5J5ATB1_9ASTE|nr:hypothetical protein F0562_030987 [Nyssa sinensis]
MLLLFLRCSFGQATLELRVIQDFKHIHMVFFFTQSIAFLHSNHQISSYTLLTLLAKHDVLIIWRWFGICRALEGVKLPAQPHDVRMLSVGVVFLNERLLS